MAMTIHPAVSGTMRRWGLEAALFAAGAFVGALTSLVVLSIAVNALESLVPLTVLVGLVAAVIVWAVVHDLGVPVPLPYRRRQVPEPFRDWMPREATATIFGFTLGIGFLTLFTYSAQLAFFLLVPFANSTTVLIGGALAFALGKSIVLIQALQTKTVSDVVSRLVSKRMELVFLRGASATIAIVAAISLIVGV